MGQYLTLNVKKGDVRECFGTDMIRPKYVSGLFSKIGLSMLDDDCVVKVTGDLVAAFKACNLIEIEQVRALMGTDHDYEMYEEKQRDHAITEEVLGLLKVAAMAIWLGAEAELFFA